MTFHPGNIDPTMYENQRWQVGKSWSHENLVSGDPGRLSNRDGSVWCWQLSRSNITQLKVDLSVPGCDQEGWIYGGPTNGNFKAFTQPGVDVRKKMTSVVRRRKLARISPVRAEAQPASELQHKVLNLLQSVVTRSEENEKQIKWLLGALGPLMARALGVHTSATARAIRTL